MTLWWLQPGWTETCCARCGARVWPDGDPDWGVCLPCFDDEQNQRAEAEHYREQEAAYLQAAMDAEIEQ